MPGRRTRSLGAEYFITGGTIRMHNGIILSYLIIRLLTGWCLVDSAMATLRSLPDRHLLDGASPRCAGGSALWAELGGVDRADELHEAAP